MAPESPTPHQNNPDPADGAPSLDGEAFGQSAVDVHKVLASAVQKVERLLGCEHLLVLLSEPQNGRFTPLSCSTGFSHDELGQVIVPYSQTLAGEVAASGTVSFLDEEATLKDSRFDVMHLRLLGAKSIIATPLVYQSKDDAGDMLCETTVGVMMGINPQVRLPEEFAIIELLGRRVSQLIAFGDYLPRIQSAVETYQRAVRSFAVGVAFVNKEGVVFDLNPSMSLLGIDESKRGLHYRELFRHQSSVLEELMVRALERGESSEREFSHTAENSEGTPETRSLRIQVQPTFAHAHDASEIVGATIVVFDITQQQQDERLTGSVMATISHDLRTPLTAIAGFSETLLMMAQSGDLPPEDAEEFLGYIIANTARMGRLVGDLLDAERLASGLPLELARSHFDLVGSISVLVASQLSFSQNCNIELESAHKVLEIFADKDRIEQVVANYLSNAVKYSPKGGMVKVSLSVEGDSVKVSVTDQGVGIPADQMEKLFGRLYRVDSDKHQGIKGTGLGLFLCKGLIELHGGKVNVESVFGEGSTFSFSIPLLGKT